MSPTPTTAPKTHEIAQPQILAPTRRPSIGGVNRPRKSILGAIYCIPGSLL